MTFEQDLWRQVLNHHGAIGKLDDGLRAIEEEVARIALEDAHTLKVAATAIENGLSSPTELAHILNGVAARWEQLGNALSQKGDSSLPD